MIIDEVEGDMTLISVVEEISWLAGLPGDTAHIIRASCHAMRATCLPVLPLSTRDEMLHTSAFSHVHCKKV